MRFTTSEPTVSTADERRHFSRIPFTATGQLSTVAARHEVKLLDISLQGALLEVPAGAQVELGEPCLLALHLGEVTIKMGAELAHVAGQQVGVQCRSIDLESISHLRRLVEVNLGSSRLLERELEALMAA